MITPVYPLFILELDDHSFREIADDSGLDWYEEQDVDAALYEGWDAVGRHLRLVWDTNRTRASVAVEDGTDTEHFREAVEKYAEAVGRLKRRPKYLADPASLRAIIANLAW